MTRCFLQQSLHLIPLCNYCLYKAPLTRRLHAESTSFIQPDLYLVELFTGRAGSDVSWIKKGSLVKDGFWQESVCC